MRSFCLSGTSLAASLAVISCLVACNGRPIGANSGVTINGGGAGTGGDVPATGGAAGNGGVCDATFVAPGCTAACGTPAGEVQAINSIDDAYKIMEGSWQSCDDAWTKNAGAPADVIGVEWGPASRELNSRGTTGGGKMYYLVAGPSGPRRGQGFAYQLDYDISPEGGTSYQINVHPAPNSGFDIRIRYSPCPNELEVRISSADKPTTMVRFDACGGTIGAAGTGGTGSAGAGGGALCSAPTADETPVAPACAATCGTPAGDVQPITSVDAAYTVMQGRWQFCGDAWQTNVAAPADAIGVEWGPASRAPNSYGSTVGGKMYYLVAGASGPERGKGFAYQLDYDISPEGGGSSYQINIHPAPNSGFWIRIRYSPCPNELETYVFYAAQPTTMVRFAACGVAKDGGAGAPVSTPDAGTATDADTCVYPRGSRHWTTPGCGATQPPEPACGSVGMLGCYSGYICNCDGTVLSVCEHWSEKPWAYFVPYNAPGFSQVTSCDPNSPPAGATDGKLP